MNKQQCEGPWWSITNQTEVWATAVTALVMMKMPMQCKVNGGASSKLSYSKFGGRCSQGGQGWIWGRMSTEQRWMMMMSAVIEDDNVNIELSWFPNGCEECDKSFRQLVHPHNWSIQRQTPQPPTHPTNDEKAPHPQNSGPLLPILFVTSFLALAHLLHWLRISSAPSMGSLVNLQSLEFRVY